MWQFRYYKEKRKIILGFNCQVQTCSFNATHTLLEPGHEIKKT